jgi:hypothetical protein
VPDFSAVLCGLLGGCAALCLVADDRCRFCRQSFGGFREVGAASCLVVDDMWRVFQRYGVGFCEVVAASFPVADDKWRSLWRGL